MSIKLEPPAETRDTGLPWLPRVPSHWDVKRAKLILRELDSRSVNGEETLLSVSQYTGVTPRKTRDNSEEQDTRSESLVGYKVVCAGDLVVNIMLAWNGSLGASAFDGVVSPAYCVYRFKGANDPNYYHHLLRTDAYRGRIKVDSRGVVDSRLRLYSENLFRIELLVPPPDEQAQIVRFILNVDQRVNRLIKAKRQLIGVLNDQKKAIIHRAVTRGLDSTVEFKPSGIFWLPEIPNHWESVRVKTVLLNFNNRRIPLSSTERGMMITREFDYYGASGVIDKVDHYIFDDDLLLIAEDGANLVLRNLPLAIIARGQFWVNNHAHILKPKRGLLEYWAMLLECVKYNPWISGAAQPKLTKDRVMSIQIPCPPESEQHAIVEHVDKETAGITLAIEKTKREIELIREYRGQLVAEVVMGQLDVTQLDLPDIKQSLIGTIEDMGDAELDILNDDEADA